MKQAILTVTFNPAIDKIFRAEGFYPHREQRVQDVYCSAGGKGLNVSRALKKLGIKTMATGFNGGVAGQWLEQELKREKIPFSFQQIEGETRTNYTIFKKHDHHVTRFLEAGPRISNNEAKAFKKKFTAFLAQSSYVVFSGRSTCGLNQKFLLALIRMAQRARKKVIVDMGGDSLRAAIKSKPFLIKPNRAEAEAIIGRRLTTTQKLKKAVQFFLKHGVCHVIISLRQQGAIGSDGHRLWLAQPHLKVRKTSAVGCGDALIAGFLYGQVKGFSFRESLCVTVAAGMANALTKQPGGINKTRILRWNKKIIVKELFSF